MLNLIYKLVKRPLGYVAGLLPTRTRITLGLVAIVVGAVILSLGLEIFPNPREHVMKGRASLTESMALSATTLTSSGNRNGLQALLDILVQRREEIISIGIRIPDNTLHVVAGPHEQSWDARALEFSNGQAVSTDKQMTLPVYDRSEKWADLEVVYAPYRPLLGMEPWKLFLLLIVPFCFLQFDFFLRHILKQLDPSAVPTHVRDVLDNLGVGLLLLDPQDRVLLANPVFLADTKCDQKSLLGCDASSMEWIQEGDGPFPWTETIQECVVLSNRLVELDVEGRRSMFSVNSTPIISGEGQRQGAMVTFKDITTLEENKREIAVAKELAEQANHAKSQFLANMSHEIRTPMNAIVGFTDVLRRGLEDNATRRLEYLDTIHSSGNHLVNLINDVLDLSKIESVGVQLEIRECSPFQIVGDVINVLNGKAADQGISLSSNPNGPIPETINTDSTRLRQILINLVGNAVKFTKQGGVRVDFGTQEGPNGPQMRFDVIDTGIGMEESQIDQIFQPFVQADSSVTRRFGGTGLGLSISKKFSEAMGGGISAMSQPGEGSIFTVLIDAGSLEGVRMLSAEEAAEALRAKQRAVAEQGIAMVKSGKILIVDDTPANVQLLQLVCGKAGLDVSCAENGQVALDKATATKFDLILMDMQMPIMDGYTATRELRKRDIATPIIALTGNAMEEDRQACFAAGCSHFLPKPVNIDDLLALLQKIHGVGSASQQQPKLASTAPLAPNAIETSIAGPIRSTLPDDVPEFQQVIVQFIDTLDDSIAEFNRLYELRDFESLARQAHALKGSGGTVGFPQFTDPAMQLETAAKESREEDILGIIEQIQAIANLVEGPLPENTEDDFEQSLSY